LPDGNVQVAFSGGRTSGMLLHRLIEANGILSGRAVVTFQNTSRERPETLDFVQEVGERFGQPIVWLERRPTPSQANPFDSNEFCEVYAGVFGADRLDYMRDWWRLGMTP